MEVSKPEQSSFFKGLVTFYLIFLALFFAAAPFLTLLLYAETDLSLSLLPQLIGFCLQGAFLVIVFAIYEKRSILNNKRSHKFALRTFLSVFVTPCVESGEVENGMISSPAQFAQGLDKIRAQGLEKKQANQLIQAANQNLTSMESLTALVAQIDHVHLEAWSRILQESRDIRDSENQTEIQKATVQLMENIQRFDELEIY
jgi:hypothetical protein